MEIPIEGGMKSSEDGFDRDRYLLKFLSIAVLSTTLALGLWPFHAPHNGVTWMDHRNGLQFGKYSTVLSSGQFRVTNSESEPEASLEIWLQPYLMWQSGTVLASDGPENLFHFSVRQVQADLLLRVLDKHDNQRSKVKPFLVKGFFRRAPPSFVRSATRSLTA